MAAVRYAEFPPAPQKEEEVYMYNYVKYANELRLL
jgi:hypothetical protein